MIIEAEIIYGGLPLLIQEPEVTEGPLGQLDSLTATLLAESTNPLGQAASLGFTRYQAIPGYAAMYTEQTVRSKSGKLTEVRISGTGLATAGEKRLRTISCAGQFISVGPVEKVILVWDPAERAQDPVNPSAQIFGKRRVAKVDNDGDPVYETFATPSGLHERWNIFMPILTVDDTYFSTTAPNTVANGTAMAPPSAPSPPTNPLTGFPTLRGQHPNGWVLESRTITPIYSGLWAVRDAFGYFFSVVPD
jgi:hypothetical protein